MSVVMMLAGPAAAFAVVVLLALLGQWLTS